MLHFPSAFSGRHHAQTYANAALAASLLALSGCGASQSSAGPQFAPPCPQPVLIRPAEDVTRYNGAGRDLTDMVLDGRITGLHGSCRLADQAGQLDVSVQVDMELARGPAARGRALDVPYFVAATEGEQILGKQTLTEHVVFPPNVDRVRVSGRAITLHLPIGPQKSGAAYAVTVGFQLTPDELQQNRARGPR
jgi:hypothetical protein